jgi:hypothetical protein
MAHTLARALSQMIRFHLHYISKRVLKGRVEYALIIGGLIGRQLCRASVVKGCKVIQSHFEEESKIWQGMATM